MHCAYQVGLIRPSPFIAIVPAPAGFEEFRGKQFRLLWCGVIANKKVSKRNLR
jgi:hypothetical protein